MNTALEIDFPVGVHIREASEKALAIANRENAPVAFTHNHIQIQVYPGDSPAIHVYYYFIAMKLGLGDYR